MATLDLRRPRAAARIQAVHLKRYLPLALVVTTVVTGLPVVLSAAIVPAGGPLLTLASIALAVGISLVLTSAAALVWMRLPGSRDVLFADLLLWTWLRRWWTERSLERTRTLYESVRNTTPGVSVELLERLSRLLQATDPYTHGHSQRVARHAVRIARAMRVPPSQVAKIRVAAAVHDVGKLYTPAVILHNPGRLTDNEFAIVKRHPIDGADMLGPAGDREITAMVRHHHERPDGLGYPDGLIGEKIPLGARIIAVADTFDAITSSRPYRSASSHKQALDVLSSSAGTQLDGPAVAAFLKCYSARRPAAWLALAAAAPLRLVSLLGASTSSLGLGGGLTPQILPVLGAAGVLAFSHGHVQSATHNHAPVGASTWARAISDTRVATSQLRAQAHHRRRAGTRKPAASPRSVGRPHLPARRLRHKSPPRGGQTPGTTRGPTATPAPTPSRSNDAPTAASEPPRNQPTPVQPPVSLTGASLPEPKLPQATVPEANVTVQETGLTVNQEGLTVKLPPVQGVTEGLELGAHR